MKLLKISKKFSNFVFILKKKKTTWNLKETEFLIGFERVKNNCGVNFSDVYSSLGSYRYTPRVGSPLSIDDPVQRVRQQNYISRWNDMFSQDRLDAMDTLRRYSDDYENNQRIIFLAIQVC